SRLQRGAGCLSPKGLRSGPAHDLRGPIPEAHALYMSGNVKSQEAALPQKHIDCRLREPLRQAPRLNFVYPNRWLVAPEFEAAPDEEVSFQSERLHPEGRFWRLVRTEVNAEVVDGHVADPEIVCAERGRLVLTDGYRPRRDQKSAIVDDK